MAQNDLKNWMYFYVYTGFICVAWLAITIYLPLLRLVKIDLRSRTFSLRAHSTIIWLYAAICFLLAFGVAYSVNYYMANFSVTLDDIGIHSKSWGQQNVIKWSDVTSMKEERSHRGEKILCVQSKDGSVLYVNDFAYLDWDSFINHVSKHREVEHTQEVLDAFTN